MEEGMNEAGAIRAMVGAKTLAAIGVSENPGKPSHYVSAYMQEHGVMVYPVNPAVETVLGVKSYGSLTELVEAGVRPEVVNVFRLPRFIPGVVEEMIALGLKDVWVQQGIVNLEAAARAEAAGIWVVMDRCIMVEHGRVAGR
jgi:predicted CoA-binding protein